MDVIFLQLQFGHHVNVFLHEDVLWDLLSELFEIPLKFSMTSIKRCFNWWFPRFIFLPLNLFPYFRYPHRTRVPGFSDCNLHNMTSIDDSCLFNLPKKVSQSWIVEFSYCLILLFISVGISEFTLYLCFKTSLPAKPFRSKWVWLAWRGIRFHMNGFGQSLVLTRAKDNWPIVSLYHYLLICKNMEAEIFLIFTLWKRNWDDS